MVYIFNVRRRGSPTRNDPRFFRFISFDIFRLNKFRIIVNFMTAGGFFSHHQLFLNFFFFSPSSILFYYRNSFVYAFLIEAMNASLPLWRALFVVVFSFECPWRKFLTRSLATITPIVTNWRTFGKGISLLFLFHKLA